ncbi:hypothetical protein [Desulfobacter curvatus]|uniref:hypothetical protein n=1 Tax=Desulfobacter curvatus TaxID=2290 RepID=UPI00036B6459|nr:hypothetical protein [Desulfobacter curvatus]
MKMKKILGFVIGLFLIVGVANSGSAATIWYLKMGESTLDVNDALSFSESPNAVIATGIVDAAGIHFENYGVVTLAT